MPVEQKVVAMFMAICPALPIPLVTSLPFFFMYLSDDERYGFFVLVIDRYIQNGFCFLLQNLLHLFLRSHVFVERFEFM